MTHLAAALVGAVLFGLYASAQDVPKLPKTMAGVVEIPLLKEQPTKIVDPVYPLAARQEWIQGKIVLDVVIDKTGAVEKIGCDEYCCMSPTVLIQAAAVAVRQWKWNPILVNGKSVRVHSKVAVNFVLDETSPPIDLCTVLRDPAFFDHRMVNVFGIVQRVEGLKILRSSNCSGTVVLADDSEVLRPLKNQSYIAFENAVASVPVVVSVRGQFQDDNSPGALGGKRVLLERVLQVGKSAPPSQ